MIVKPMVVGPLAENAYIVGSEETGECAVIDPGAEPGRILEEVERLGLTVKVILNTHGHGDHIGGVAAIKDATGATYGIHEGDVPLLRRSAPWAMRVVSDFRLPPEPDMYVKGGDIIEVGDIKLTVIETPGHTRGGVCYYGGGVVFTGDTLFQGSIGRFDPPEGNGRLLLRGIITKLMVLPAETRVYPGHGPDSTIARERLTNPFLRGGLL
ncbi:MAG: putative metallo-beta-lactamase family protein [Dehalococcoidia bacterium]|nr:putative metallo-beta-lactamase family protein [Dehalococcoidia bacterium]